MATDPNKGNSRAGRPHNGNGSTKWLLGALGLLWVSGLAVRALRHQRLPSVEYEESSAVPLPLNRLRYIPRRQEKPLPHSIRDHERRDANAKWIFGILVFLLVSGLAIHGILAWFLSTLKRTPAPTDLWKPIAGAAHAAPVRPPFPALQVSPPVDLQSFRAREDADLRTFGWVNRTAGIVRIPIDQAMELVLQKGLPTRSGNQANQPGPSARQLIQQRPEHRQREIQGER